MESLELGLFRVDAEMPGLLITMPNAEEGTTPIVSVSRTN